MKFTLKLVPLAPRGGVLAVVCHISDHVGANELLFMVYDASQLHGGKYAHELSDEHDDHGKREEDEEGFRLAATGDDAEERQDEADDAEADHDVGYDVKVGGDKVEQIQVVEGDEGGAEEYEDRRGHQKDDVRHGQQAGVGGALDHLGEILENVPWVCSARYSWKD